MNAFELHTQLEKDCRAIGRFALCRVLLMQDANYPWCILVPERAGISEFYQLEEADYWQCMQESLWLGRVMMQVFQGDKLNTAALGNQVPQLHIHHIVRYTDDPAWPGPVWGALPVKPYSKMLLLQRQEVLQKALQQDELCFFPE